MNPDGKSYGMFINGYSGQLVKVIDQTGDGKINREEYIKWANCNSRVVKNPDGCFSRCDLDSNGFITPDEVIVLINQFFQSVNPSDPGNYFYGELD